MSSNTKVYEDKMKSSVEHLSRELAAVRAGRANPAVLDKVLVDSYGAPTPIQQVASVAVSEARTLTITPWDRTLLRAISKAILASDVGINPIDDGQTIRLNFPAPTEERRKQLAGTMSGGEQQMLAMGRALMSNASMLMLDEPSMGLSPLLVQEIFDIIQDIHKEGMTILLVEQNAQMALSVADRAYVLETGRVVMDGTGAELLTNERVRSAYAQFNESSKFPIKTGTPGTQTP